MSSFSDTNVDPYFCSAPEERNEIVNGFWLSSLPKEIPYNVKYVISMIGQQNYKYHPHQKIITTFFEDADILPPPAYLHGLADLVNTCRKDGVTLIHCLAGLNRSALIAGLALVKSGMEAQIAVDNMRRIRGQDVLHNKVFLDWLLKQNLHK